ncbi:MAG TPA: FecR domain-containing protein [Puia sp.]|nr:FecR domain-containing protein [Puia sp.]
MGQEHKEYTWNLIAKKLSGEASPEELKELERLLRNHPELHYPMQTITDLWNTASPNDQKAAEQAFTLHLDRIQELDIDFNPGATAATDGMEVSDNGLVTSSPHSFTGKTVLKVRTLTGRRAVWLVSACCLALVLAIVSLYPKATKNTIAATTPGNARMAASEILTGNGSRTHVVLPDGSIVWLNAGSKITYDKNFGATHREVNLTGEGFFDVARNAGMPFVIHTARIDVKVLGTRFNVKSYPTDRTTETTLIHGSIEVSIKDRPSEKIILKPNEKLVVSNDDSTLHRTNHTHHTPAIEESLVSIRKPTYEANTGAIIETSWVDNKLIFQDEEFGDLARQMERWYGVSIRFENPAQQKLRFTGSFQKETIQQALEALQLTDPLNPFNYTIHENQITIYDK